ncbi:glycosyltransferase [Nocardioides sp. LHG3406-4]|uniref:glycosyltransferase n=1 Tax=Nocardioides sp. LHG3406-4 TaxID=2804575 RepID=UPI003CF8086A
MTSRARNTVEVLYISSAPSPDEFARMKQLVREGSQTATYGMPEASFKFHTLVQEGLTRVQGCHVYSVVGRAVAPALHRGRFWPRRSEHRSPNHVIDHMAFPNVALAKQGTASLALYWRTLLWRWRTRKAPTRLMILDGAYVTAMPAPLAALVGARVARVGIFCDLYSYMADVADASHRDVGVVHKIARRVVAACVSRLDAFVVLTPHMTDVLPVGHRPSIVMEGLVSEDPHHGEPGAKSESPTVLYAGALRKEYGLEDLVVGFQQWDHATARLIIYGDGDYAEELREIARADPRVQFHGPRPLDFVMAEERRAWLLVNPRPIDQEFTKYSFPSKNMEYLASGTPVVTTRLPGMPAEYYDHVLTIDQPGPEGVRLALGAAFASTLEELNARGAAGRAFVLQHKNNVTQARRIVALADEVIGRARRP